MIVITGGAGFIGSALVWKFNEAGEKNLIVVDREDGNAAKWENLKKRAYNDFIWHDEFITRLEANAFKGAVNAVFHMGASSDTTEMDRDFLRANNSAYSERIAKWCLANNVYFCYASSAAAYGNGELGFSDDDKLTPRLKPLNPYGQSKLDFDVWVLKHGLGPMMTGFRFFNVYGPNEYHKGHMRSMLEKGLEQIHSGGKIRLFKSYKREYPDGGQKRDFVYIKDVVDAMFWFFVNQKWKGIYNLGQGRAESWNELAGALFNACGKPVNIEYFDMPGNLKKQYQYFTEADMTKFKSTGCPVKFKTISAGASDYVRNHLLNNNLCL